MPRPPPRRPPQVITLDAMGAGDMRLHVTRVPSGPPPPTGPLVSTFFTIFVFTAGRGRGRHLETVELRAGDVHLVPEVEHQPLEVADLEGWIVSVDPLLLRALGPPLWPGQPRIRGEAGPAPARSLLLRGLLRLRPEPARLRRIEQFVAEMAAELRERKWAAEHAAHAWLVLLLAELVRELQEHARCVAAGRRDRARRPRLHRGALPGAPLAEGRGLGGGPHAVAPGQRHPPGDRVDRQRLAASAPNVGGAPAPARHRRERRDYRQCGRLRRCHSFHSRVSPHPRRDAARLARRRRAAP
nr:hypothetical protein [Nannocystis pusilla]